jgi:hypothetical protein
MTYRMTVVLEYASVEDAPRLGPLTEGKDMGKFKVCAMQFSDALRELEVLDDHATDAVKDLAFRAAYSYPGCTDPRRPSPTPGDKA